VFHLRPQSTQLGAAAKFEADLIELLQDRSQGQAAVDRYMDNEMPGGREEFEAQSTSDLAVPFETVVLEVGGALLLGILVPGASPAHSVSSAMKEVDWQHCRRRGGAT
jgi:hypothetical protein